MTKGKRELELDTKTVRQQRPLNSLLYVLEK